MLNQSGGAGSRALLDAYRAADYFRIDFDVADEAELRALLADRPSGGIIFTTVQKFALLDAVAGFMGRVVEIEDLKLSLHRLEESLAITRAVMEDSSIRDAETDLPNLRYLEVWQRALLGSDQRPESLVVAEFHLGLGAARTRPGCSRPHDG